MAYTDDQLNDIFDRTDGLCHLCRKKLAFKNYGNYGARAAWEVDHDNATANGGLDVFRNWLPACISCNRSKQAKSSKTVRNRNGYKWRPASANVKKKRRTKNTAYCAVFGGYFFGPIGAVAGVFLGSSLDTEND